MDRDRLLQGDLLPGLRRAAEGLIVPPAPVHAGRGPLARPHVIGLAVPEAARSDDHQSQDTGYDLIPKRALSVAMMPPTPVIMPGPSQALQPARGIRFCRMWRASVQSGSGHRRPGRSLASSAATWARGDFRVRYAAPSRRRAWGHVDRQHHAEWRGTSGRTLAEPPIWRAIGLQGRCPGGAQNLLLWIACLSWVPGFAGQRG